MERSIPVVVERVVVGTQKVVTGRVRVEKRIDSHAPERITLRREEVNIERDAGGSKPPARERGK